MKEEDKLGWAEIVSIIGIISLAALLLDNNWFYAGVCVHCFVMGFIGYIVGKDRTMGGKTGYVWGFVLSIIGLLFVIASEKKKSTPLSIADELSKLAVLKENGYISEDEFAIQKSKLLQ